MTQAQLAERAGISRTAITAIEGEKLVPSVATALAIASVLELTVEELFGRSRASASEEVWAWEPSDTPSHFWRAEVAGRRVRYPSVSTPTLSALPDSGTTGAPTVPEETLVIACCDPAAGLLASLYAVVTGLRLLVIPRSSRQAIEMLRDGFQMLRIARWQEGIVFAPATRLRSIRAVRNARLTWIGREPGSGARQCMDQWLRDRSGPRHIARNHRGVTEAVQSGWADAGVCVQLASVEAGLNFLPVQEECYDVCFPRSFGDDRRLKALLGVVRSPAYRRMLADLPGYNSSETGQLVDST